MQFSATQVESFWVSIPGPRAVPSVIHAGARGRNGRILPLVVGLLQRWNRVVKVRLRRRGPLGLVVVIRGRDVISGG